MEDWKLQIIAGVADLVSPIPCTGEIIQLVAWFADSRKSPAPDHTLSGAAQMIEQRLNEMIQRGKYDEAKNLVRSLGLPYTAQEEAVRRVDEMRKSMACAEQWNRKVNDLLREGDVEGAVRFVRSLDLPTAACDDAVARILVAAHQRKARIREVEKWMTEIARLLGEGRVDKAKKYVASLPIAESAKRQILASM